MMETINRKFMKRAIALARRGVGRTAPNPAVGCVIVKDGRIVGEGWHRKAGAPHAEVVALDAAGPLARGAELYVTLEPCSHFGKTPPCVEAIINAGVGRVFAGMIDPYEQVAGKGIEALRKNGVEIEVGLLEADCRALNPGFIKYVETGMPYVIYKSAMTLDGNIATVTGQSRWITCEDSRKYVHKLRNVCDAVMVGVDTILADNPRLNVRHVRGRNPYRIIVDTRLRTPESVSVLSGPDVRKTIIATCETNPRVQKRYELQGAKILVCEEYDGRVMMKDLLAKLGKYGVQTILLEGGSRLASDMIQNGLIDECIFFYAPKIVGNGFSPFAITGIDTMDESIKMRITGVGMCGSDAVIRARPEFSCSQA